MDNLKPDDMDVKIWVVEIIFLITMFLPMVFFL